MVRRPVSWSTAYMVTVFSPAVVQKRYLPSPACDLGELLQVFVIKDFDVVS